MIYQVMNLQYFSLGMKTQDLLVTRFTHAQCSFNYNDQAVHYTPSTYLPSQILMRHNILLVHEVTLYNFGFKLPTLLTSFGTSGQSSNSILTSGQQFFSLIKAINRNVRNTDIDLYWCLFCISQGISLAVVTEIKKKKLLSFKNTKMVGKICPAGSSGCATFVLLLC